MIYTISAVVVLYGFWLLLSGFFTLPLLAAGLISAVAVVLLTRRMGVIDREGQPVDLGWAAATYWPWLMWEIVKAAWDVAKIIVHPRLPISPTMIRVKTSQRTSVGIVTYANSITLTPGTISVEADDGEILVHALTRAAADGLAAGDMDRRVSRFEGAR
ncbi:MAG TPA: Na+/H+ antiporter subunit E [Alphaproteobacteria bacterium]|nr:Na+/H+ antiporter subunit E [Alphaproteobacteria bacterium]